MALTRSVIALSFVSLATFGGLVSPAAATPSTQSGIAADYCAEAWSQNHPTLSVGSTGNAVRHAQCKLGKWGHPVTIDGQFGTQTRNAVKAVQRECNIDDDGIIGLHTWRCID